MTPLYLKFQLSSSEITERVRSIARQMDISISSINIDSGINELVLSTYEWNTRKL